MKPKDHEITVRTDNDEVLDTITFTMRDCASLTTIKSRMAEALNVSVSDIEFVENSQESEGPDVDGFTTDVYEVYVKGKFRESVWIEDEWWYR